VCDADLLQLRRKAWRALPSFFVLDDLVLVDDFPEVRAGDELRFANGRNADGFAGGGVAARAGSAFNGTEAAEANESHGIAHRNGGHDFFKNAHDDTVSFSFGNVVACGNAVNEVETIHLNTPGGSARPRQLKGMWRRRRRIF